MRISTHEMFPIYEDGKLDKGNAMIQCVGAFERHDVDTLEDIYVLITQEDCVYAPIYWRNNQRKIENALLRNVDLIIFDSDDGDTEEEIKDKIDVEFLLLRTASWSKELEKYRIIIPLEIPISFEEPEDYTYFVRWLGSLYDLTFDKSTTECGRGYIGIAGKEGSLYSNRPRLNIENLWEVELKNLELQREKQEKRNNRESLKRQLKQEQNEKKFGKQGPLKPEHLVNKPKFKEHLSNIVDRNYNNGIISIIGYFAKSGCERNDVRDWLVDQHFGNADAAYIDKRMKNWRN